MDTKKCSKCGKVKPISEFYYNCSYQYHLLYCKSCSKKHIKNQNLQRNYNITVEQYDSLCRFQEGKCLICGTHQKDLKRPLVVDHDHETEEIRGLLCANCNAGLGMFKDNIKILLNAIDYLRK